MNEAFAKIDFDTKRMGRLAAETLEQWTIRFHKERGMPVPDAKALAELMRLNGEDERNVRQ